MSRYNYVELLDQYSRLKSEVGVAAADEFVRERQEKRSAAAMERLRGVVDLSGPVGISIGRLWNKVQVSFGHASTNRRRDERKAAHSPEEWEKLMEKLKSDFDDAVAYLERAHVIRVESRISSESSRRTKVVVAVKGAPPAPANAEITAEQIAQLDQTLVRDLAIKIGDLCVENPGAQSVTWGVALNRSSHMLERLMTTTTATKLAVFKHVVSTMPDHRVVFKKTPGYYHGARIELMLSVKNRA
jgi:hypothetical protein